MPTVSHAPIQPKLSAVVDKLVGLIGPDAALDLGYEDPVTAIELHFNPLRAMPMPGFGDLGDTCSTDGFYETLLDPVHPTIVFDSSVSPARARFTIVHELGHHIFATTGAHLLDELDVIGRSAAGAMRAEEMACHEFAGRVLISDRVMVDVLGDRTQLLPSHLAELRTRTTASWDAIAVRCVNWAVSRVAVVLIREPGVVSSSCSSPRFAGPWWPKGSCVQLDGPLASALERDHTAVKDLYRSGLAFAEQLYCDSLRINDQLAVCVLSGRPTDGRFDILEPPEPSWMDKEQFCAWDGDERDHDWCDRCSGRLCRTCGRCGCEKPIPSPTCPGCDLPAPANPGFRFCRSCILDGRDE